MRSEHLHKSRRSSLKLLVAHLAREMKVAVELRQPGLGKDASQTHHIDQRRAELFGDHAFLRRRSAKGTASAQLRVFESRELGQRCVEFIDDWRDCWRHGVGRFSEKVKRADSERLVVADFVVHIGCR